jgi:hypothetical protein
MINSLLQEIEYYDSRGFYKLADKLTSKLLKYSREFSQDIEQNFAGLGDFTKNLKRQIFINLVSNACAGNIGFTTMNPDVFDQALQKGIDTNNADQVIKDLSKELEGNENSLKDAAAKGDKCAQALMTSIMGALQKHKFMKERLENIQQKETQNYLQQPPTSSTPVYSSGHAAVPQL